MTFSFRRYRAVAWKECLHILRDWRSLTISLALPVILLLMFGYALSLDVDRIPAVVYDQDRTPESRDLISGFSGSRYFTIELHATSYGEINREIDTSRALMGIVVPPDYSENLLAGRGTSVQLLFDGSDSNTAAIARGYANSVVAQHAVRIRDNAQDRRGAVKLAPPVDARTRVLYNEDMRSRNYIVPGLIAVILMIISAQLTSLTIAREWEMGTMEQLISTPVRPVELLLGKLTAFFAVGMVDLAISLLIGVYVFNVPLKGSALELLLASVIFLFGALCWGIMISTIARNQLVAFQLGMLTSFLPAFLLSGFIYAVENMPVVIQAISYLVPARYFVNILKAIFLKGIGLAAVWFDLFFLTAYAAIVFLLAVRRMRMKVA